MDLKGNFGFKGENVLILGPVPVWEHGEMKLRLKK